VTRRANPSREPEIGRNLEGCGLAAMQRMLGFVGVLRAGVSLGLTGRYAVQSAQVRAGLDLWAADQPVELVIIDDQGSPSRAMAAYHALLADGIEILLGPYGSGTVRHVAPVVCGSGRLLWNHGGAADDLASPLLATVVAPASTYLASLLVLARDAGLDNVLVAPGRGRFAEQVANGGRQAAKSLGLRTRRVEAGDVSALLEATASRRSASLAEVALVVAGTFEEDVAVVRRVREARVEVGLLGCVAAGIDEFGRRLGRLADGVVGPAQWWCRDHPVDVGPSGPEFVRRFEGRVGRSPDYLAAQAAAAGYLAAEAAARGYGADEVRGWQANTLLGPFRLDTAWRQAGHVPVAVQWRRGRRVPAAEPRP
jgi:ABC-type branched-subunit amino acid transport system substrate-binding protein